MPIAWKEKWNGRKVQQRWTRNEKKGETKNPQKKKAAEWKTNLSCINVMWARACLNGITSHQNTKSEKKFYQNHHAIVSIGIVS